MKLKQYQTSVNLDKELLSEEQKIIRDNLIEIKQLTKKCNTCDIIKPISCFRKRTTRHGKKGVWYDAKCKDCHARVRGTIEIGKISFAKEIFTKGFRRCTVCKTIKPISDFYTNKAQRSGIDYTCKKCKYTKK